MVESERAFIFTHDGVNKFFADHNCELVDGRSVVDYYLSKNTRIRKESNAYPPTFTMTTKSGSKGAGIRTENESNIDAGIADLLKGEVKLVVDKRRYRVNGIDVVSRGLPPYNIVVDFINQPIKVAILEIEQTDSIEVIPQNIAQIIFNEYLQECPLSIWEYCHRKIGICGAPSSGKTTMAHEITQRMNAEFKANAFHAAEYATSFIQKYNRTPTFYDQFIVWHGQHKRERDAKNNFIISDCPTFLTYIYLPFLYKKEFNDCDAMWFAKMYKNALLDISSYGDIILLAMKEYSDNGIRYQTENEALEIERKIRSFLNDHNIRFITADMNDASHVLRSVLYLNRYE